MAFQPVTDTVKLELIWADNQQRQWQNNLYFTKNAFTVGDMNSLAAAIEAHFANTETFSFLSNQAQLDRIKLTDVRTADGAVVEEQIDKTGGSSNEYVPIGSALVVTLRTAKRGRSYRGRLYFSGLGENTFGTSDWSQDVATDVIAFLDDLTVLVTNAGWTWVLVSRQQDFITLPTAVTEPITGRVVRSLRAGSQRRRNDRP